jgi:gliding motility-associated-like protein
MIPMTWQNTTTFINLNGNNIATNCFIKPGSFDLEDEVNWKTQPTSLIQLNNAQVAFIPSPIISYNSQIAPVIKACRSPNPCPKNCNEEVSHLKLIKEKRINKFIVNSDQNEKLLITGNSLQDGTSYYGSLNKDGSDVNIKSIEGVNYVPLSLKSKGNFRYLLLSINNKFSLRKESLTGEEVYTKVYNFRIRGLSPISFVNDRILVAGEDYAFCLDLDGNMIWSRKIQQLSSVPVHIAGIDGIWHAFILNNNKELNVTKIGINGSLEISKIFKLPYPTATNSLLQGVASVSGGLVFKLLLNLPEGNRQVVVNLDKVGSIQYSKYVENDIGSFSGYAENNGYVLHHTVIPSPTGVKRQLNLIDPAGTLVFTKELNVLCDVSNISNYKHGWILNCLTDDAGYLVYLFPESKSDCMIKDALPQRLVDIQISSIDSPYNLEVIQNNIPENFSGPKLKNLIATASKECNLIVPCIEICDNNIDDDDNGLIDCNDQACPCNECLNKSDLVLNSIDSIYCEGNEYIATLSICNTGDADFTGSLPVTFYNGNPWNKSVIPLSANLEFNGTLKQDSCTKITYRLSKYRDGEIFAVINASANLPSPFNPNRPLSALDCDLSNNTQSITFAPSIPLLDLGPDREICRGQIVDLSAQEGFTSYLWQDFLNNRNYTAFTSGLYSITVSDYCGVLQKDEILIKEKIIPAINLGENKKICKGSLLELSASSSVNGKYLWDDGIEGPTRKIDTSGKYTLGFYTSDNCVVKDTINVDVVPFPIPDLIDSISICEGNTYLFTLPQLDVKYKWFDNDTAITKQFTQAGVYSILVNNGVCELKDSIRINLIKKPIINLPDSLALCVGDSIELTVVPQPSTSYLWNTGQSATRISINKPGIFHLLATKNGCISRDTVLIKIVNLPELNLPDSVTLCEGDIYTVDLPLTNSKYLWYDNDTSNTKQFSQAGNYSLKANNELCELRDSISISVTKKPILNLPDSLKLCNGDSIEIAALPQSSTSYLWSTGQFSSNIFVKKAGVYTLVANKSGCSTSDTVYLIDFVKPTVSLPSLLNSCEGDTVILKVDSLPGLNIRWSNGLTNTIFSTNIAGRYEVTLTNGVCVVSDTTEVIFNKKPIIDLPTSIEGCDGTNLGVNLSIPSNTTQITWSDGTKDLNKQFNSSGTYFLSVQNQYCQSKDTIVATYRSAPEKFDLGKDTILCDELQLDININNNPTYTYSWNDSITVSKRTIDKQGKYILKIQNNFGCSRSDTIDVKFVPVPIFDLGVDTTICKGDSFSINLDLPVAGNLVWDDKSSAPKRVIYKEGRYTATYNYLGCNVSDDIVIKLQDCNPFEVFLPNIFKSNTGPNGIFKPIINGDPQSILAYDLKIFDRWGNVVFASKKLEEGWDGTNSNSLVDSGVYVYAMRLEYNNKGATLSEEKSGTITFLK